MRALVLAASALLGIPASLANIGFANVAAAGTSGCTQLGGNVQSGNVCRLYVANSQYEIQLNFGTDYPDDQPVADYIAQMRDEVISAAQAPGAEHLPYAMHVNFYAFRSGEATRITAERGQPWHGTASLVLQIFKNINQLPAGITYKSFNFDYDQNRPVTFDDLFVPGTNPMDSIYPAVAAELKRQFIQRDFTLAPDVGRDPAHYQKFAITDDSVIFFFSSAELQGQEAGYYSAAIPRSKLPPLAV